MVRKASEADLPAIMRIVAETVRIMAAEGNDQWNDEYPRAEDFRTDISKEELFVDEEAGAVCGFVCVNREEPPEYGPVPWSRSRSATVVHRLAVDPDLRGRGIASILMRFAEETAAGNGTGYLRSDTYSKNPRMNGLFEKLGFRRAGDINFKGRRELFHCYEKVLDHSSGPRVDSAVARR
ncbi:MAG: hypothetical protein A2Z99_07165 [Treponema sp. GWB1_62_6]|nr:MAG: hypothetical protein A2Y36_11590 [Treponema sp. GWA1_62_8]OHE62053.1 MAG: hypothetical protein A2Z99_07165 [Treponema sp. GWB1_62_6]OHE65497.1 MAG: hypothetical protein A2001_10220 [Treponema sp. GWC1_61_84]OHE73787.1 MAG: hypothetical protein A2413_16445 [Treponema sp. RIFOXYC1_FULL_61_9]HCM27698.1 GNAT family N-acetyltransferase [Treponema sp.]